MKSNILYDYYAEIIGEGEKLIFLPAAGFSGNEGLNVARYLQDDFETHMVDLPGLGQGMGIQGRITSLKMANWLKEYLDQKNIDKASFIGHSLGGGVLLAFANHYPEKIKSLVLLDQGHKPMPRIPKSEFGAFAYSFPVLNVMATLFGHSFLKLLRPLFEDPDSEDEDLDKSVKQFCDMVSIDESPYVRKAIKGAVDISTEGLNLIFGYYNLNLPKLLKQIKVPTYLAYATFTGVNERERENTYKYIKKLELLDGLPITYRPVESGHYVHWSDPTLLADLKVYLKQAS
ncbi:alpha/beta hydrolase [Lentibacillus amyloliquefaciens]|uniref:Hydrolase n=1 Tax=Lentibacillus amyloliquefaciens TaxID=1472767 RepID=A0A0U4E492_9BACI|nr:alpha/beta hydrolase [Lentibacillus amyloliquefaciens]ALX47729.1 hydrolase [Lentibacillus amyloliquefaciens]